MEEVVSQVIRRLKSVSTVLQTKIMVSCWHCSTVKEQAVSLHYVKYSVGCWIMQVLFILGAKSLSLSTPVFLSLMERVFFLFKEVKIG